MTLIQIARNGDSVSDDTAKKAIKMLSKYTPAAVRERRIHLARKLNVHVESLISAINRVSND